MKNKVAIIVVLFVFIGIALFVTRQDSQDDIGGQTQPTSSAQDKTLDLSGQSLTAIPPEVLSRNDISTLNISNNQFTSIPSDISTLQNLSVLIIDNNRLEAFSQDLGKLSKLTEIYANNNRLESVPNVLSGMTQLKVLDLSGNNIPSNEITALKALLKDTEIKF